MKYIVGFSGSFEDVPTYKSTFYLCSWGFNENLRKAKKFSTEQEAREAGEKQLEIEKPSKYLGNGLFVESVR